MQNSVGAATLAAACLALVGCGQGATSAIAYSPSSTPTTAATRVVSRSDPLYASKVAYADSVRDGTRHDPYETCAQIDTAVARGTLSISKVGQATALVITDLHRGLFRPTFGFYVGRTTGATSPTAAALGRQVVKLCGESPQEDAGLVIGTAVNESKLP